MEKDNLLTYRVMLSREAKAILDADFDEATRQQLLANLEEQLSVMPNRFAQRPVKHLDNHYYRVIVTGTYAWAFIVKVPEVWIVYGNLLALM